MKTILRPSFNRHVYWDTLYLHKWLKVTVKYPGISDTGVHGISVFTLLMRGGRGGKGGMEGKGSSEIVVRERLKK